MTQYEMEGFLRGKCVPGDMKVNETDAEYLVRKFKEKDALIQQLADIVNFMVDFDDGKRIPDSVFEKARKLTNRSK